MNMTPEATATLRCERCAGDGEGDHGPCPDCHGDGRVPAPEWFRNPYVGEGADGARRSAQIDREEMDTLDRNDPRLLALNESAHKWDEQADIIDRSERY